MQRSVPKFMEWAFPLSCLLTANKIPLPSAGKFSDQSGPPKQRIIIEGIAPISAKPINLGLWVMPLKFRFNQV